MSHVVLINTLCSVSTFTIVNLMGWGGGWGQRPFGLVGMGTDGWPAALGLLPFLAALH